MIGITNDDNANIVTVTYCITSTTQLNWSELIDKLWKERLDALHEKQWLHVKHEAVPYIRATPRPLVMRRTSGRGMYVRRVKPLNRRNA